MGYRGSTLQAIDPMNAQDIVSLLKGHKGQHIRAVWQRPLKTRKGINSLVLKRVCYHVRAGIDYANLATVKDAIANGERGQVQPLPWGEWVSFPFIIGHKGAHYVRLYPASFDNLTPSVEYTLDGKFVDRTDVEPLCLASEFRREDDNPPCFTLRAETLISLG